MQPLLLLAPVLLGLAVASYDPYMNVDMAKLYRMQLLANAINDYIPNEQTLEGVEPTLEDESPYAYWPRLEDMLPAEDLPQDELVEPKEEDQEAEEDSEQQAIYNDPLYSGAQLRDEEHIEHSNLHGYQSMTGGTAEGKNQNDKQVKSDKLPAYCNPPNPCPVGKTAAQNCVENFENTAANNERLLSQQECSCDTEHMFKCPAGSKTVSTKAGGPGEGGEGGDAEGQMTLNKVMGELAKMEQQEQTLENNRRLKLVAKKSPHFIRKRSEGTEFNPYFHGDLKAIAAKKSPKDAKISYHYKQGLFDEFPFNN